jgi:DNA-binding NarL/FixJ family response regulator
MVRESHGLSRRLRLVIADDHPEVRQEIRELLNREFDVLRAVADGAALLAAATELKPDAVVSDIQMPELDGIEAGCRMLQRGLCNAIVVLSVYPDRYLVETAMRAGILGYVLKLDAFEELIPAIHTALRGERYLSAGVRGGKNSGPGNQ